MTKRGLVGAWCQSLGATGLRLLDRSGRNNHGTLTNMASTAWVTSGGKIALAFDGANDNIEIPDSLAIRPSGGFSLSAWFRRGSDGLLLQNYSQTPTVAGMQLGFNVDGATPGRIGGLIGRGTGVTKGTNWESVPGTTITSTTAWSHGVFVFNLSTIAVFLNGTQDASKAWAHPAGFAAISYPRIGVNQFSSTGRNSFFSGEIDDARIFNRALTAPEIRQMYIGGRGFELLPERPRRRARLAAAAFKAYWARRQSQLIGGGL